jgi:hypothetical protein
MSDRKKERAPLVHDDMDAGDEPPTPVAMEMEEDDTGQPSTSFENNPLQLDSPSSQDAISPVHSPRTTPLNLSDLSQGSVPTPRATPRATPRITNTHSSFQRRERKRRSSPEEEESGVVPDSSKRMTLVEAKFNWKTYEYRTATEDETKYLLEQQSAPSWSRVLVEVANQRPNRALFRKPKRDVAWYREWEAKDKASSPVDQKAVTFPDEILAVPWDVEETGVWNVINPVDNNTYELLRKHYKDLVEAIDNYCKAFYNLKLDRAHSESFLLNFSEFMAGQLLGNLQRWFVVTKHLQRILYYLSGMEIDATDVNRVVAVCRQLLEEVAANDIWKEIEEKDPPVHLHSEVFDPVYRFSYSTKRTYLLVVEDDNGESKYLCKPELPFPPKASDGIGKFEAESISQPEYSDLYRMYSFLCRLLGYTMLKMINSKDNMGNPEPKLRECLRFLMEQNFENQQDPKEPRESEFLKFLVTVASGRRMEERALSRFRKMLSQDAKKEVDRARLPESFVFGSWMATKTRFEWTQWHSLLPEYTEEDLDEEKGLLDLTHVTFGQQRQRDVHDAFGDQGNLSRLARGRNPALGPPQVVFHKDVRKAVSKTIGLRTW